MSLDFLLDIPQEPKVLCCDRIKRLVPACTKIGYEFNQHGLQLCVPFPLFLDRNDESLGLGFLEDLFL